MSKDWVKIYSSDNFYKAEIVRQILVDHEIESVIINKQGFPYNIGVVEVYIHQTEFQKAIEIIIRNDL